MLIKINIVWANFNNTRSSLISNITNGIYRPWLPAEASAMTYVIYKIDSFSKMISHKKTNTYFNAKPFLSSKKKLKTNATHQWHTMG
jgi:hypothetical protein